MPRPHSPTGRPPIHRPSSKRADAARPARASRPARDDRGPKPPIQPHVTTLWDYPSQNYGTGAQGDSKYAGVTPSHVIWNVIWRYTTPKSTVLDPFCGSGTTLDVCRDLDRVGLGFDLAPTRPAIKRADARDLPVESASVDLVFMDPPYGTHIDYSDDPRCIGKLPAHEEAYYLAMNEAFAEAARVLKPGGTLAVYVCDSLVNKGQGKGFWPIGFELFGLLRAGGFEPIDIVAVVRHNKTLEMGNYRKAADEGNFFLRGFNYLLLFHTPEAPPPVKGAKAKRRSRRSK